MRFKSTLPAWLSWLAASCVLLALTTAAAQAKDLKFEALLVWATNAENPPDPNLKPIDGEVLRRIRQLPLKWKNYFAVTNVAVLVPKGGNQTAVLSEKCQIKVGDVDGRHVQVSLIGKGEPVLTRTQPLPVGNMLVLGGNAPNESGWLVVLKRVE